MLLLVFASLVFGKEPFMIKKQNKFHFVCFFLKFFFKKYSFKNEILKKKIYYDK